MSKKNIQFVQKNLKKAEFLRQEYAKRNFFLFNNDDLINWVGIIKQYIKFFNDDNNHSERMFFVEVLIRDIRRYTLCDEKKDFVSYAEDIKNTPKDKYSEQIFDMFVNYDKILLAELECVQKYNFNLFGMVPAYDICQILISFMKDEDELIYPNLPLFLEKDDFYYQQLYRCILNFGSTLNGEEKFITTEIQKEYIDYLRSNHQDEKAINFELISSLRNNKKIADDFLPRLYDDLKSKLSKDFRTHTFGERLKGLLYYDYVTAVGLRGGTYKVANFLHFLGKKNLDVKKRNYNSKIKRKYNDYLKIASNSIHDNVIRSTSLSGSKIIPKNIKILDEFAGYLDSINSYLDLDTQTIPPKS